MGGKDIRRGRYLTLLERMYLEQVAENLGDLYGQLPVVP
jgi:hypothetical protein